MIGFVVAVIMMTLAKRKLRKKMNFMKKFDEDDVG
jgi:hypothetical protein